MTRFRGFCPTGPLYPATFRNSQSFYGRPSGRAELADWGPPSTTFRGVRSDFRDGFRGTLGPTFRFSSSLEMVNAVQMLGVVNAFLYSPKAVLLDDQMRGSSLMHKISAVDMAMKITLGSGRLGKVLRISTAPIAAFHPPFSL